jgi:ppGpp synthetase/RelA/SpoT-type nucleotidyltranferase
LQEQDDILNVVKRLQRRWHIRRARFYIEGGEPGPKEDGYRAVHLIVAKNERFVEVQFRTPAQDDWANSVEQDTRLEPGLGLKWGSGPSDLREYYRVIAEYMAASDRGIEADPELRDQMVRLYAATRKHFPPAAES